MMFKLRRRKASPCATRYILVRQREPFGDKPLTPPPLFFPIYIYIYIYIYMYIQFKLFTTFYKDKKCSTMWSFGIENDQNSIITQNFGLMRPSSVDCRLLEWLGCNIIFLWTRYMPGFDELSDSNREWIHFL